MAASVSSSLLLQLLPLRQRPLLLLLRGALSPRLPLGARAPRCAGPAGSRGYAEPAPASASGMALTFASPYQVFFNGGGVRQVDVPTLTGMFGILPNHVPTLAVLRPGLVTVFKDDGTSAKFFVSSGSLTVNADSSVQLLAEEAVPIEQLDVQAARAELARAQGELSAAAGEIPRAEALIAVEASEALVKALE
ncbi:ATP synthase F(1) complex subunit delta, mitochondrial [Lampetra fluviatilis]